MLETHQRSPLSEAKRISDSQVLPEAAGIQLSERAFLGHINLRGDPEDQNFRQTVATVLSVEVPLQPNTVMSNETVSVLWLGPDEWLIITAPGQETETMQNLINACEGLWVAATDVSSAQTIINVSGGNAKEILAKGCSLDLHSSLFSTEHCAQTLLAKASVVLRANSDDSIDIIVRRSFADYLWHWLKDASAEYGLVIV